MSLRMKLIRAASEAAEEACTKERGRVLWVISDTIETLEKDFEKKLLAEGQRALARIRLEICKGLANSLKHRIIGGEEPPPPKRKTE